MTLIDLDRVPEPGPAAGLRPPPRRYRHAGLLLAAVLLITLGGAAPGAAVRWRYLGLAGPMDVVEMPLRLAGGNAYTASSRGIARELTAWRLDPEPERLWTSAVPIGAEYEVGSGLFGGVTIQQAADSVLVSEGYTTTAMDVATGRIRWTMTNSLTLLDSGGTGVVVERVFRPGTEYDQASGDPGALYFSATGVPHTEPPLRTEVRGVDLVTGKTLWTAAPGGSVTVDPVPGTPAAVLITSSQRLTLLAGATGETLAEAALPERDGSGPSSGAVAGQVALVGYETAGVQAGYDVRTLRRLWEHRVPRTPGEIPVCLGVICSGPLREQSVLDPATGEPVWPVTAEIDLEMRAGAVLETQTHTDVPVRLADPLTGRTVADLTGWDMVVAQAPGSSPGEALVLRRDHDAGRSLFGVVLPGHAEVRVLGAAETASAECAADERHVVCRDEHGLGVWAYRI
ncbi:outer membrane protein assembly factor BamB family protein [Actinoplanes missouriensis]|uniref:outer membrane protein assembly factor BamB family protein n=1 Tax=Actinoplanes missouriensis TaxID=1866 RepID=UPI0012FBF72B|nr:PQQ-binding-like beta-propeller repeat protein [Actinoplanes missouriensis]